MSSKKEEPAREEYKQDVDVTTDSLLSPRSDIERVSSPSGISPLILSPTELDASASGSVSTRSCRDGRLLSPTLSSAECHAVIVKAQERRKYSPALSSEILDAVLQDLRLLSDFGSKMKLDEKCSGELKKLLGGLEAKDSQDACKRALRDFLAGYDLEKPFVNFIRKRSGGQPSPAGGGSSPSVGVT